MYNIYRYNIILYIILDNVSVFHCFCCFEYTFPWLLKRIDFNLYSRPLPRQVAEESGAYVLEDGQKVWKKRRETNLEDNPMTMVGWWCRSYLTHMIFFCPSTFLGDLFFLETSWLPSGMTSPFLIGVIERLNPGPPFSSNRYVRLPECTRWFFSEWRTANPWRIHRPPGWWLQGQSENNLRCLKRRNMRNTSTKKLNTHLLGGEPKCVFFFWGVCIGRTNSSKICVISIQRNVSPQSSFPPFPKDGTQSRWSTQ